jgi:insertion element IS1 protein InsB
VSSQERAIGDVALISEMDKQSGWVGNKHQQHWLFYGFDTKSKRVLAHVLGPRTTETLRRLLQLLKRFSIGMFTADCWPSYQQQLSQPKHRISKIFTQRIERHDLTLRIPSIAELGAQFAFPNP